MELIDTHCHLAHGRLRQQVEAVLERARSAGVRRVICAAADALECRAAAGLAERYDHVYCTAGIHPHEAASVDSEALRLVEQLAGRSDNVAVGEIGLDYHYDFSPRPDQHRVFAEQLQLALRLGKPIVIHTREALEDTLSILAESGVDGRRVAFHSFTEGPAAARRVLDFGATIGFSGIMTFKKADDLRQAAALAPDDRILVETDSPYLSPEPVRKMKTNEPANVAHVAACLAGVRGTSLQAVAELTTANAVRLFALQPPAGSDPPA